MGYYVISPVDCKDYPDYKDIINIKLQDYIKVIESIDMLGVITVECADENLEKLKDFTRKLKFICEKEENPFSPEKSKEDAGNSSSISSFDLKPATKDKTKVMKRKSTTEVPAVEVSTSAAKKTTSKKSPSKSKETKKETKKPTKNVAAKKSTTKSSTKKDSKKPVKKSTTKKTSKKASK